MRRRYACAEPALARSACVIVCGLSARASVRRSRYGALETALAPSFALLLLEVTKLLLEVLELALELLLGRRAHFVGHAVVAAVPPLDELANRVDLGAENR